MEPSRLSTGTSKSPSGIFGPKPRPRRRTASRLAQKRAAPTTAGHRALKERNKIQSVRHVVGEQDHEGRDRGQQDGPRQPHGPTER